MRAVAILVIGFGFVGLFGVLGCNSEATVCPNPAACDQTPVDAAPEADAGGGADTGTPDVTPDAAAETG